MTVSAPKHCQETEETVLDGMIRAGLAKGYGWEDLCVQFTDAGFKIDRDHVRRMAIPKLTAPSAGQATEGAKGMQRGT